MQNNDLVSVVISTYNRPTNILMRAISSVLAQTYTNIELIVVNDCPDNKSLVEEIRTEIESVDRKIKYIVHEKNSGACAARNTGLEIAEGRYIAFLDDDDEWLPNKIEKQLAAMTDDIVIVGCDSIRVNSLGQETEHHPTKAHKDDIKAILRSNYLGSTSFPLLLTSAVKSVGGFDVNVKSSQDYDLWIRLVTSYKAGYVYEPLVKYYLSEDSTFKRSNEKYIQGSFYLMDKYKDLYHKYPDDYLYKLNTAALTGLLYKKDFKMYYVFKRKAFSFRIFHRYNYFMLAIKMITKICQRGV